MSFLKNKYDKLFQRRDDDTLPTVDRTPKATETTPTVTTPTTDKYTGPTYTVDELVASLAGKNKYEQLGFTPEQAQSAGAYTPATKSSANKLIGQYGTKQFNYNPETDPNYQAYLKLARENGKLAMEDTLAKASAMTGGYSNSNAQLAGQKVYNQHLSEAEANMGNYYAMALDAFNSEQNTLLDRINLAWSEEDRKKADAETQRQNAITDAELKAQYGDYSGLVDLGVSQDAINKYKDTADWTTQYAKDQAALERAIAVAEATGDYTTLYKLLNYSDEQIAQLNNAKADAEYDALPWVDKDYNVSAHGYNKLINTVPPAMLEIAIGQLVLGEMDKESANKLLSIPFLVDSKTSTQYTLGETIDELKKAKFTQADIQQFLIDAINNG